MNNNISYIKISIITPSYNQGQYLEETILSVLNQNYPNLEYIIIDGGSTDNSVEIIKKYEDSIVYWVSEKDRGQTHAINKGFEKATGEIFGWINSDDYYLPGYLFKVASAFYKKKTDIVYANSLTLSECDGKIYREYGNLTIDRYLVFGSIVSSHTAFWRKNIHQTLDENINCAMDYEFWLRLLKSKRKKHINDFGAVFRYHEESKSGQNSGLFSQKWKEDDIYIAIKHKISIGRFLKYEYRLVNGIYKILMKAQYKMIHRWRLR